MLDQIKRINLCNGFYTYDVLISNSHFSILEISPFLHKPHLEMHRLRSDIFNLFLLEKKLDFSKCHLNLTSTMFEITCNDYTNILSYLNSLRSVYSSFLSSFQKSFSYDQILDYLNLDHSMHSYPFSIFGRLDSNLSAYLHSFITNSMSDTNTFIFGSVLPADIG